MSRLAALLGLVGALTVALGIGMLSVPAGVIAAGIEALVAAYVIQYWEASQ